MTKSSTPAETPALDTSTEEEESTTGRGGRKSKAEQLARPYTVFLRGKMYYMSYTGWREDKKKPGTIEKSLKTKSEPVAHSRAKAAWPLIQKREAQREDRDSDILDPCFASVLEAWLKQELARSTSTGHKKSLKGGGVYLLATCLTGVGDVGTLSAKKVLQAVKELRAACTIEVVGGPDEEGVPVGERAKILQASTFVKVLKMLARIGDFAVENSIPCTNFRPILLNARRGTSESRRRPASDMFDPVEIDLMQQASDALTVRTNSMGSREKLTIQMDMLCRRGEVALLRPQDVNFERSSIMMPTLKHYHNNEWFEKRTPKDVDRLESRELPMTPRVRALMEAWFSEGGADPIGRKWPWLFPAYRNQEKMVDAKGKRVLNADGKPRVAYLKTAVTWKTDPSQHRPMVSGANSYLRTVIKKVEKMLGVKIKWRRGSHIFRHTLASTMYKMVMDVPMADGRVKEVRVFSLEEIKTMAGHVTEDGKGGRGFSSETLEKHYLRFAAGVPSLPFEVVDWHTIANFLREKRAAIATEHNRKMPAHMAQQQVPLGSTREFREEAKLAAA